MTQKALLLITAISLYAATSNAQTPYIEIKNHSAQIATYGQIDLSKKRGIRHHPKFQIQLPNTDSLAVKKIAIDLTNTKTDTLDILIYIHAMWGGVKPFQNKILRDFAPDLLAPQGNIDKILPIIWHSGARYRKNLTKARTIGELLGANIGHIMRRTQEMSKHPVRFHLLCHSMGHQVFRSIYKVNDENEFFRFGDIIFAAADLPSDIFGSEWGGLPQKCDRLTYFVNQNDPALKYSEKRLKIKRLGKSRSVIEMRNSVKEIDVTEIKDTKRLLSKKPGHGYFFASPTVKEMIIRLLNQR